MNIKKLLFFSLFFSLGTISTFGQCTNCADVSNVITNNGNGTFTATSAQAYFWEIENCDGSVTIVGSNTGQHITVNCNIIGSVKIKVTRFIDGNCIEACEVFTCPNPNSCGAEVGPPGDLNIEGDDNLAFISVLDLNSGWSVQNINFQVTFQDGTVVNYNGFLQPPIHVQTPAIPVSCNNPVVAVTVTVRASNGTTTCSDSETTLWRSGVCDTGGGFSGLKVYPNPTKSRITFKGLNEKGVYSIIITDSYGDRLITTNNAFNEIDLSKQKSGIYFYTITDSKGNSKTGKIILK